MTQGTKTTSATSSDSEDLQMAKGEEVKKLADLKRIATKGDGVILTKPLHIIRNSRFKLLVFMVVMYVTVMYADLFKDPTDSLVSNIRMALFAGNLVIVFMGVQFLPEPSKKRPFPLFWRIAQAAAFAYALNILMWLCFSSENLQFILGRIYDNKLGKPLPEKSYADDCRVYTPDNPISSFYNITSAIDVFVVAHFLGWTFKIWIFRNSTMAWFLSIMFEIMEWTMEVWLPNFKECWWDHFLFDMFGCNFIGMLIGIWTIRKFKMRKLYWFMEPTEKSSSLPWYKKITYIFTSRDEYVKADKWHWLSDCLFFRVYPTRRVVFVCVRDVDLQRSGLVLVHQLVPGPELLLQQGDDRHPAATLVVRREDLGLGFLCNHRVQRLLRLRDLAEVQFDDAADLPAAHDNDSGGLVVLEEPQGRVVLQPTALPHQVVLDRLLRGDRRLPGVLRARQDQAAPQVPGAQEAQVSLCLLFLQPPTRLNTTLGFGV